MQSTGKFAGAFLLPIIKVSQLLMQVVDEMNRDVHFKITQRHEESWVNLSKQVSKKAILGHWSM